MSLQLETEGSFEDVDGMLGCPLALFPPHLVEAATFPGLPAPQQQVMALGLFHAANWLRELLNGFCSTTPPNPQRYAGPAAIQQRTPLIICAGV